MRILRTVIAEDNAILRASVMTFLRGQPNVTLVSEAKDGEEAVKCVDELDPDLLILDMTIPKLNGWQVLHHLQERKARTKVIVFSTYANHFYDSVKEVRGVVAFINKEDLQGLVNAIAKLATNMEVASKLPIIPPISPPSTQQPRPSY